MNFKITSHRYENTGGHCMVSFDQIWMPDEGRTIFSSTNESGVALYVGDQYFGCIDDLDPFDWVDIDCNDSIKDHHYYDLFRELMRLFAVDEWRSSKVALSIPFVWLTAELQAQVSDDYKYWCENIACIDFETDGEKIIPNLAYVHQNRVDPLPGREYLRLVAAMRAFRDVCHEISGLWEGEAGRILDGASADYPFDVSFDELHISRWVEAVLIEAAKNQYKERDA